MSAAPLPTRPLHSLHQQIPLSEEEQHHTRTRLLEVLRPSTWEYETPNTPNAAMCLDMAMDMMMHAIASFDKSLAIERGQGKRVPGAFISAIGVPDFEVKEHQDQIIGQFNQYLEKNLDDAPTDRLKWSQDFGFRLATLHKLGAEIPIDLGRHWLSLGVEDLKLSLSWTQRHCAPVLGWKRTDKGARGGEGVTTREKIGEQFLSAQRLEDLSKRV